MIKTYLIGRSSKCDFVLNDQFASREHLQIIINDNGEAFVMDLGSTSGTSIDGTLIEVKKIIPLKQHNVLRAGTTPVPWKNFIQKGSENPNNITNSYDELKNTINLIEENESIHKESNKKNNTFKRLWQSWFS